MGEKELTKVEALKLITPVVDNEVSSEERRAFMNYIAEHEDVRKKYESIKNIKLLVHSRCPCAKAPDRLRNYIKKIQREGVPAESEDPIYDVPCSGPANHKPASALSEKEISNKLFPRWLLPFAASILIAAITWGFFIFLYPASNESVYNVEENAYQQFVKHQGKFIQPTISTPSLGSAEIRLASDFDMPMTVPSIQNAELKGIVFAEFVPHYNAPMLEYYIPSEDQYIYIFAFKLDRLEKFGHLVRDSGAVKACNKPKDYYIRNINGKHVVSWKWNNVWYAAISNQDGKTLVSLVGPLQKNPASK
ncbi:MAG: hypothetical protein PVH63_03765 [Balneolaceae bacterium]|jgi:hypothetical protein